MVENVGRPGPKLPLVAENIDVLHTEAIDRAQQARVKKESETVLLDSVRYTAAKLVEHGTRSTLPNGTEDTNTLVCEAPQRLLVSGGNLAIKGEFITDEQRKPIKGTVHVVVHFDPSEELPEGRKDEVIRVTFAEETSSLFVRGEELTDPQQITLYSDELSKLTDELTPSAATNVYPETLHAGQYHG